MSGDIYYNYIQKVGKEGGRELRDFHGRVILALRLSAEHVLQLMDRVHEQVELLPPQCQLLAERVPGVRKPGQLGVQLGNLVV